MSDDTVGLGAADGERPERPDSDAAHAELPGRILAARRQELNWSVEDVAHSLHLAPRQILAIEADNYNALPGMAVTRGFIRSYAKLLKLDSAPLLQMIAKEGDAKASDASLRRALPAKPFYANRSLSLSNESRSWPKTAAWAVVIIVLLAIFIAWKAEWLPHSWISEAEGLIPSQSATDDANVGESAKVAAADQKPAMRTPTQAEPPASESSEKPPIDIAPAQQAAVASNAQGASLAERPPAHAAGESGNANMLVLRLREDSWIEVRNSRNKVLLSRLAKAGESEAIPVGEPLRLVIGNAAGVDAQLRGVPVELNASAKNNVARLTVN